MGRRHARRTRSFSRAIKASREVGGLGCCVKKFGNKLWLGRDGLQLLLMAMGSDIFQICQS
jgi:hypothetical protein